MSDNFSPTQTLILSYKIVDIEIALNRESEDLEKTLDKLKKEQYEPLHGKETKMLKVAFFFFV